MRISMSKVKVVPQILLPRKPSRGPAREAVRRLDGQRILGAHIDEALAGSDRVGGDGHAFDHALRIAFEHAAVHECTRVALVSIADHILLHTDGFGHRAPLEAGGVSAASAPAQSAPGDLLNHRLWVHLRENVHERQVAAPADEFVDLFRIDLAGVLQNDRVLALEVVLQMGLKPLNWSAAKALDDGLGICFVDISVQCSSRAHGDQRSRRAGAEAASLANVAALAGAGDFLGESRLHLVAVLGHAPKGHTDVQLVVELFAFGDVRFRNLL